MPVDMTAQTSESNSFEKLSSSQDHYMWTKTETRKETDEGSQACRTATKAEIKVPASENSRREPVTLRELYCNKWLFPTSQQQLSKVITFLQTTFKTC